MQQLLSITLFSGFGILFVIGGLVAGWFLRPNMPNREKKAIYECGEPTIGTSWVQFDLRFYIVALFYLVFDVEVALTYPWAAVFRQYPINALIVGLPFLAIIIIGFAYEWYSGSLDWVRSAVNTSIRGTGHVDMKSLARRDPEALEDSAANPASLVDA